MRKIHMVLGRILTVRRGLTCTILLLAGLIQALMMVVLTSSLAKREAGRTLEASNRIAHYLQTAEHSWTSERSVIAGSQTFDLAEKPIQLRRDGEAALEKALELAREASGLSSLLDRVRQARSSLRRFRPDEPLGDRDHMNARKEALQALTTAARDLRAELLVTAEDLEPAASLVRLQSLLASTVDYRWQELAARQPETLDGAAALGRIQGRLAENWHHVETLVAGLQDQRIADDYAQLEQPPADPAGLQVLQTAAFEATERAALELIEVSKGAIGLGIALFICSLLAGALAVATLHFGLFRPLGRLAETADALSRGHGRIEIPGRTRQDEVGALARALGRLHATARAEVRPAA